MEITTKYRTQEAEIMDDFSLEGEELRDALDKIANINKLLGGNKLTLNGIKQLLEKSNTDKILTIVDVGCGNGDMLRMLADYGRDHGLQLTLIGIDANRYTVNYAEKISAEYKNISFLCLDIFEPEFKELYFDIVLCTLTLHHFKDDEILNLMATFNKNASLGVIVNDLHRSKAAYRLFQAVCSVFSLNSMSREDGLVSILRGFKRKELEGYSKKLNLKNYTIHWRWAFRYQWIISKL